SPNAKPEILIRFKEQRFRIEPQGLEKRRNLPNVGTCEELHETDHGFKINKKMRLCDRQQREEWKQKDPSKVSPPRMKEIAQKGEKSNLQERNSSYCLKHVQTQGLKEGETPLKITDSQENFTVQSRFVKYHISNLRTKIHSSSGVCETNPIEDNSTKDKLFKCTECDKRFSWKSELQRHEMVHTGEKPFQCAECGKSFSLKGNLQQHKLTHTGEKPFQCSVCDKCFCHKSSLQQHKRVHTGSKPFKCSECDKSFSRKALLNLHKMAHTGEKPFKCSECDKCFSQKGNLQLHKMTHTQEKPFKCSQCNKYFRLKQNLRKHEVTHMKEKTLMCSKPLVCSECDKCFSRKALLQRHKKTHAGEKKI
ncbi:gastrula zinc finger protein xLCGF3.1-like, partial [Microcaecilia unicolor]